MGFSKQNFNPYLNTLHSSFFFHELSMNYAREGFFLELCNDNISKWTLLLKKRLEELKRFFISFVKASKI